MHFGGKRGAGFDVSGCGQRGILACLSVSRSVRTATVTYENTDDTACLWASP